MKIKKISAVLFAAAMAFTFTTNAFADGSSTTLSAEKHAEISNGLNSFSQAIVLSVPEAATQQNVWSDSYIGLLFPDLKFGAGFSIGGTQLDMSGFKSAATSLCGDISIVTTEQLQSINSSIPDYSIKISTIPDTFILPSASVDLRIGGVLLPFDIGVCAMATSPSLQEVDYSDPESLTKVNNVMNWKLGGFNGSINYMAWGLDARYCIYEGDFIVPKISVGGGYYSVKGSFAVSNSTTTSLETYNLGTLKTDVNMGISYTTKVAFGQVQANKDLGAINLFGGVRGIVSASTSNWSWKYVGTNAGTSSTVINNSDSDSGSVITKDGIKEVKGEEEGTWNFSGVQPQIFLGASGSFFMCKTSFSLCADIRSFCDAVNTKDASDFIWSGAFSVHFQM